MTPTRPRSRLPATGPQAHALAAVFDVGQALATTRDHELLLTNVIDAVRRTVGATAGGFMLYDPVSDELVLQKPAFGVHAREIVGAYRVAVAAGGNAARVFLSRDPYLTNDARRDPRMLQRFIELFDARCVITVPLVLGDRAVGVFHAINKPGGLFTADDLALLTLIAPLLASSLQSAQMFKALETERRQLARAMAVHAELMRAAADGQGIAVLAATLHRLLGRTVWVLDAAHRPLAAAGAAMPGARALSALGGELAEVTGTARLVMPLPRRRSQRLTAVAIRLKDETAGHILVGEAGESLDTVEVAAVEQAALVFALEILKERSAFEADRRVSGEALRELLTEGTTPAVARRLLRSMGASADGPWRVARLGTAAAGGFAPGSEAGIHRALLEGLRARQINAPLWPWRDGFIALLVSADAERLRAPGTLTRLQRGLAQSGLRDGEALFALGVGREEANPETLVWSLRTAEQALLAAARLGAAERVIFVEDLGVYRLLLGGNRQEDYQDFMTQTLGRLLAPAQARLLATLEALLASDFNQRATARALGLHENTVKYRLGRIIDLLGVDPARGERRLEIELALKIRHLRQP